jgi:amidase
MKKIIFLISFLVLFSCQNKKDSNFFKTYDESELIQKQQDHKISRMKFKLVQSKVLDMNTVFQHFNDELSTNFSEEEYNKLKPLILEQNIPSIQKSISEGLLSHEKLTLFYLYRIRKLESNNETALNAIISLNPNALKEARAEILIEIIINFLIDISMYGMPVLIKDNINTAGMPTTAGAIALSKNENTEDAYIIKRLKEEGAIILGKSNLSEWAYYFCGTCPLGYSATGGQTLNPYGRTIFESGGSSSGSGVAVAANYAVAALGTETSGSIISPSSQNSVVGLKPTVGLLSRTGIIPISSTLDTPGPMTKNVMDSYILFNSMLGYDASDPKSIEIADKNFGDIQESFKGKRFGVFKDIFRDSIFKKNIDKIKEAGGEIVLIAPKKVNLPGFLSILNLEMKDELPKYLKYYADKKVKVSDVEDIISYNNKAKKLRAPYGQLRFINIGKDTTSQTDLERIKIKLKIKARTFFEALETKNLDAILSMNNSHSAYSAVAEYPNLTIPMGYKKTGEPISLTFIGKSHEEGKLLLLGYTFEQLTNHRKMPKDFK